jgi:hypothetical protein
MVFFLNPYNFVFSRNLIKGFVFVIFNYDSSQCGFSYLILLIQNIKYRWPLRIIIYNRRYSPRHKTRLSFIHTGRILIKTQHCPIIVYWIFHLEKSSDRIILHMFGSIYFTDLGLSHDGYGG